MAKRKATLKNRPFVLIIRDGWGYNPDSSEDEYNTVKCASTPVDDMLMAEFPNCPRISRILCISPDQALEAPFPS